jgi:hypothetical protein
MGTGGRPYRRAVDAWGRAGQLLPVYEDLGKPDGSGKSSRLSKRSTVDST